MDLNYNFWKGTVEASISHRKRRPSTSNKIPINLPSLPSIKLKTRRPTPNKNNRQRPRKRPRTRGPRPAPLKNAPSSLGKTTPVFPLCSETSNNNNNKSACQLAGGQLRGPGGIVVRPPPSHPVVQIHVNDMGKLPALAFYPADSTINRRAEDAIAATTSTLFSNTNQNIASLPNSLSNNNGNIKYGPYNPNNAGQSQASVPLNSFQAPRNNPSSVQNNLNAISYIQPPQNLNPSFSMTNNPPQSPNPNYSNQIFGPLPIIKIYFRDKLMQRSQT